MAKIKILLRHLNISETIASLSSSVSNAFRNNLFANTSSNGISGQGLCEGRTSFCLRLTALYVI